jgi:hypothetical protein
MEQKETIRSKRQLYSVYVSVRRDIQAGRSMARRKRLNQPVQSDRYLPGEKTTDIQKFLYVNVTKVRKIARLGYICIQIGVGKNKELHYHDMRRIESLQIRKHDRSGRIQ